MGEVGGELRGMRGVYGVGGRKIGGWDDECRRGNV